MLKKIAKYIQDQNEKIYAPRGLLITDPIERGMRVVSFLGVSISIEQSTKGFLNRLNGNNAMSKTKAGVDKTCFYKQ